ncbi:ABC transporter ATP-binding protein [Peribacillus alkalitolerans]|uniref:ABC transporter ATP-binding protein n=1 Tax=Peribacillus alkalitolerans TaxID=1550385 RepID=UPI0013D81856|nr:ABC transporter ATP-binding protein [Peribacillus alkalitolerans]
MLKQLTKPFSYPKVINLQEDKKIASTEKKRAKNMLHTIKRIWNYLAVHKVLFILVVLMVFVSSACALLGPYLIGMAIDDYIVTKKIEGFVWLLGWLTALYVINSFVLWVQNYWMIGIAQKTVFSMRMDLFKHFHKLPISYFDKKQQGELMSRITNDIENVSSTLNSSVIQIASSTLILIGTVVVMFWLSPILAMITLLVIPTMVLGMKWITKRTSRLYKEQQKNLGNLNGYIQEIISGQKMVKAFSQEEQVISEFLGKSEQLKGSGFWALTYSGFIPKLMNVLNNMSFALIAGIGGVLALNDQVSIGVIVIFIEYSRQFVRPLNDLANQFNTLLSAVAGAERVFEILDEEEEFHHEKNLATLKEVKGKVEFRDVSFSYEGAGNTVQNLTFNARPGETVALVGPTGAGKTTVLNLLSRFYDFHEGSIYLDGEDITHFKRESVRAQMAFVLQDSFLFQGTVMENIRYGRLDATDDEVMEAAKKANAHSFIMKLPNGYKTILKQEGAGISQGQKQLLSIARAFVANPSILILDEATSSIDTVTELKIQQALKKLMHGRTSFVIAHRLNTIQNADQIIVLQDGVIIESGTHEELLRRKGFYHSLHVSGHAVH